MIFINQTMFTGDRHIPNLTELTIQNVEIFKQLAKWEKEALELALGKCLMEELLSQMEVKGEDESKTFGLKDSADQKWKYLIEGRKYQNSDELVSSFTSLSGCGNSSDCNTHYWDGLVTETKTIVNGKEASFKESLLADYVYYQWSLWNESRTTGVGEQKPISKNSINVSNKLKRLNAFNSFCVKVRGNHAGNVGLHTFILEHKDLYPTFHMNMFQPINLFDV